MASFTAMYEHNDYPSWFALVGIMFVLLLISLVVKLIWGLLAGIYSHNDNQNRMIGLLIEIRDKLASQSNQPSGAQKDAANALETLSQSALTSPPSPPTEMPSQILTVYCPRCEAANDEQFTHCISCGWRMG